MIHDYHRPRAMLHVEDRHAMQLLLSDADAMLQLDEYKFYPALDVDYV